MAARVRQMRGQTPPLKPGADFLSAASGPRGLISALHPRAYSRESRDGRQSAGEVEVSRSLSFVD
jgi:hypothetical protein